MSIPRPNTLESAPIESLPIPLAPDTILVPATQEESEKDNDSNTEEPSDPQTSIYTQPSPNSEAYSVYTDAVARLPYNIELEEALTLSGIDQTLPTFGDENEQKCMRDLYNFLIIIACLSADQKSLSDSTLKSAAAIDVVLTETVLEIMQSQTTNAQAIAEVTNSVKQLDSQICKENHETGELQTQVSSI